MAVTLSAIKVLLLEQGSMSSTSNNRILGGGALLHTSLGRWVRPGRRGALLCASLVGLGSCHGKLLWAAQMTHVLLRAPSRVGNYVCVFSRSASPEHDVIGIN